MQTTQNFTIYLANASSPHVPLWTEYLNEADIKFHIYSIHQNKFFPPSSVTVKFNFWTQLGPIGSIIAYILLGIWLRFFLRKSKVNYIHAHNTSGYGLSAYLSNKPYIVTTYGSEIFQSNQKSKIYNKLIANILQKSKAITTTSMTMETLIIEKYQQPPNKIKTFSLGVSTVFNYSEVNRNEIRKSLNIPSNATVWFANRRITPLYNTLELVNSFISFIQYQKERPVFLILLRGECDINYYNTIIETTKNIRNIHIIKDFLSGSEMAAFLSASDISISIPKSDQLSSSILEALTCKCIPFLNDISAYQEISSNFNCIKISNLSKSSIEKALNDSLVATQNIQFKKYNELKLEDISWNRKKVLNKVISLYK